MRLGGLDLGRLEPGRIASCRAQKSRTHFPERHFAKYDRANGHVLPRRSAAAPPLRDRDQIPDRFKWNLSHIFPDWDAWQRALRRARQADRASTRRSKARWRAGPSRCSRRYALADEIGQLSYMVWYFASLKYDEDQRDNDINAQAPAGADSVREGQPGDARGSIPSCSRFRSATVQQWMDADRELAVYRFAIEELYRQQEHVLDDKGEHLLSLSSRFSSTPERRLRGAVDR